MRHLLFIVLVLGLTFSSLHAANDSDKLVWLGSYFESKNGILKISLSHHWLVWENGTRQFFPPTASHEVVLKPGDFLIVGDGDPNPYGSDEESGFYRYKLDKLTLNQASFTVWTASIIREQIGAKTFKIRAGDFVWKEQIETDLPLEFNDDSEVNGLELSSSKPSRTK